MEDGSLSQPNGPGRGPRNESPAKISKAELDLVLAEGVLLTPDTSAI